MFGLKRKALPTAATAQPKAIMAPVAATDGSRQIVENQPLYTLDYTDVIFRKLR